MPKREEDIKAAIKSMSGEAFERFAFRVLRAEEYHGINPTSESHDLGEDAHTEPTTIFLHQGKRISVCTSKTSTIGKLKQDCQRAKGTKRKIDIIVFATAGEPTEGTKDRWRKEIKRDFKWDLVVHSLDYFSIVTADDKHATLIDDYFQIPPPGGDFPHNIEAEFARHTEHVLSTAVLSIEGLNQLPRDEVSTIESQLNQDKQVLFTGEAGTGKSGVSAMLAASAKEKGFSVLLLDARKVNYIQSENDLRRHLNLNGPVDEAIARVARKRGCRVIIDQFDNAMNFHAVEQLIELAQRCRNRENTEFVIVSRKNTPQEKKLLKRLLSAGFIELTSHALSESITQEALRKLDIALSVDLIDLASNLLNLSLIATIKARGPSFDFSRIFNEIDLWESYLQALIREESIGLAPDFGDDLVDEAANLASESLKNSDDTFHLDDRRTQAQKRLDSWNVIIQVEANLYRFRHEQLRDFLFARKAVSRRRLPVELLNEYNEHRMRNVLLWMDRLYAHQNSTRRRQFMEEIFAPTGIPFHTQTAVLHSYMRMTAPASESVAVTVILKALKDQEGLSAFFFRYQADSSWATLLWEAGFFDQPPEYELTNDRFELLPFWDAQNYLLSIASAVPDLIVKHINQLPAECRYIEQAVRALCFIPGEWAEQAVPKIRETLSRYTTGRSIVHTAVEVIEHLLEERRIASAFNLFRSLIAPHPSPHVKEIMGHVIYGEAISLFDSGSFTDEKLFELANRLTKADSESLIKILEEHVKSAIAIEASARKVLPDQVLLFWTNPFDEPGVYSDREYKGTLFRMLRKALEEWADREATLVQPFIEKYLSADLIIFRRLAQHLLQKYPTKYVEAVRLELRNDINFDITWAGDEFLKLLRSGYPHLKAHEKKTLLKRIRQGFSTKVKESFGPGTDPTERQQTIEYFEKRWIRDHLAMLKDFLPDEHARVLAKLIEDCGEPNIPGSRRDSMGAYRVHKTSPISKDEIADMSVQEIIDFITRWEPPVDQHGSNQVSLSGLADLLAEEILVNSRKYKHGLDEIALVHHEFASHLLTRLTKAENYNLSWEAKIRLCEKLLSNDTVRNDTRDLFNGGWTGVRRWMVWLIGSWFDEGKNSVPPKFFPRVCNLLLTLCQDSDPCLRPADENPKSISEESPNFIAANHVRTAALSAVIEYAWHRARLQWNAQEAGSSKEQKTEVLEDAVRDELTRKLDPNVEAHWAARSVYGEHLFVLHWLDEKWLESHLEDIFPEGDDEQTRRFYVAAWDAYVKHNAYPSEGPLGPMLRSKYQQAIENIRSGRVSRTSSQPARDLAYHLLMEYLNADFDLRSPAGQQSLIAQFFKRLPPAANSDAAWVLWDICHSSENRIDQFWPRARALWQWRVDEASVADHSSDYDDELNWLTFLLKLSHGRETLKFMWPLLEGSLPHIARQGRRGTGWNKVEEYLALEAKHDPLRAIKFYHLMHAERKESAWRYFLTEEAEKIVEAALNASEETRLEALNMADMLSRHKNYQFMYVIDQLVK
jgi:hypothetical protein